MDSGQRFEQGAGAKPPCFTGYGIGDGSASALAVDKAHRQLNDGEWLGETGQDVAVQAAAASTAGGDDAAAGLLTLENDVSADSPERTPDTVDREARIEELRNVLEQLNAAGTSAPDAAPDSRVDAGSAPQPAAPEMRRAERDHQPGPNRFRATDRVTGLDAVAETGAAPAAFTIADLRRAHMERAKRHVRAHDRRKRGGSLLTGLTLMSLVVATMVGLYVLHPQIVAAQPQLAPVLDEYVEAVDRYRALGEERSAAWRQWLAERIGNLTKTG